MAAKTKSQNLVAEAEGPAYAAPALEKGLDILELLCRNDVALSQKEIAQQLGRTTGELYRMVTCLTERGYLAAIEDRYIVTTKLFELAHLNPPTHRLLTEALPIMQKLSSDLEQSCHLTVYNQGRQIVVAKVDSPTGMGFSVRVGAELDVLVSASGRVLLAFQTKEIRAQRISESIARRPDHADVQMKTVFERIKTRGFESSPSVQVRGLYAVSFPIFDTRANAVAALTVPYAERIDQANRKPLSVIEASLGAASRILSSRIGGHSSRPGNT
jgi:DNA-binding IclR family transcriptional regulator